jgi:8-oxo-dGTP pyrophosphatase MutT (NUDIX family)
MTVIHRHEVGVAVVMFNSHGDVLMQERVDNGYWCLPGGRMDNETPQEAIAREVKEELGLDLPVQRFTQHYFIQNVYVPHKPLMLYFSCVLEASERPRLMEPEKHYALQWFSTLDDDLPHDMWPNDMMAIRVISKRKYLVRAALEKLNAVM